MNNLCEHYYFQVDLKPEEEEFSCFFVSILNIMSMVYGKTLNHMATVAPL